MPEPTQKTAEVKEQASYTHGHHASVVQDHARRTAADSAAYLLPHIKPTDHILDVGCGPGTITADLALLVPSGTITGCDSVPSVLEQATAHASTRGISNITFQQADGNALPFADASFDIVHCHQLLQHVAYPVAILREMRRVAKPNGLVAAREADFAAFAWYPLTPEMERWRALYQAVARANGGEPDAGRYCHVWARAAGFHADAVTTSWGVWRYEGERAAQFARSWASRILQQGFVGTAEREGLAGMDEIRGLSEAWARWAEDEMAFIAIPHGEILCRKR